MEYWTYAHNNGSNIRYRPTITTQYENKFVVELVDGTWPEDDTLISLCLGGNPRRYISGEVRDGAGCKRVSVTM